MKCKIFGYTSFEAMENHINKFLSNEDIIDIVNIYQTVKQNLLIVTIFYIPKK